MKKCIIFVLVNFVGISFSQPVTFLSVIHKIQSLDGLKKYCFAKSLGEKFETRSFEVESINDNDQASKLFKIKNQAGKVLEKKELDDSYSFVYTSNNRYVIISNNQRILDFVKNPQDDCDFSSYEHAQGSVYVASLAKKVKSKKTVKNFESKKIEVIKLTSKKKNSFSFPPGLLPICIMAGFYFSR